MLKFRLSDETRVILNRDKSVSKLSKKQINYYNSPEFYAKHPDLMPRDIYLASGRTISRKEIDNYISKNFKPSFKDRLKKIFNLNKRR